MCIRDSREVLLELRVEQVGGPPDVGLGPFMVGIAAIGASGFALHQPRVDPQSAQHDDQRRGVSVAVPDLGGCLLYTSLGTKSKK